MRSHVQKVIRDAHYRYVNGIFTLDGDDSSREGGRDKSKKFWSYVNNLKGSSKGIASLRDNGILKIDSKEKANILNRQFHSAFTVEDNTELPDMGTSDFSSMSNISVDRNGVLKLLNKLNPNKASGPDNINARILKECSGELADILTIIFDLSLHTGEVPSDWRNAFVAPIYKKGDKYDPANYRPVSLTCISCKILEHIIVSNIMRHVNQFNILTDIQHGFRKKRSCETQLVQFFHDLANNLDGGKRRKHLQTDVLVMDFAKAFDKVPHKRLMHKLNFYGIRGNTSKWIEAWLNNRSQVVVLDSTSSDSAPVVSGVPQGSVLGPVLFLLFINDLPLGISSSVRLFADDCVLYRNISSYADCLQLQEDLSKLQHWEKTWLMKFNVSKCQVMRVSRHRAGNIINHDYLLNGQTLEVVDSTKYLGVTFNSNLDWSTHISNVSSKATRTLGFLRRNLAFAPQQTKAMAYKTLVRPQVEYASPVWAPYTQVNVQKIEKVQRTAARWVSRRWRKTSSVDDMLSNLSLDTLEHRREVSSLCLFYKMHNDLVSIDRDKYLSPKTRLIRTRQSHPFQYNRPSPNTDCFKYSFFPRVVPVWNGLYESTASCTTVDSFKHACSRY